MAIRVPACSRVRFAVAVLSLVCAFRDAGYAASEVADKVSLSESTIRWSTVKYATNKDNGFI